MNDAEIDKLKVSIILKTQGKTHMLKERRK